LTVPSQILSPVQNVVTLEGQATSIPFNVGVLSFDGVDDFVTTSPASALGLNGSFTASAWVFPTATDTVIEPVFGTQTAAGNQGLHLGLQNNRPFMGFFGNDLLGNATLQLNQWHQITWVYNQTASTQTIFVNGILDATKSGAASFTGTDPVLIGRAFSGGGIEFFAGSIDGARIFNRALSAAEVLSNMTDGVPLNGTADRELCLVTRRSARSPTFRGHCPELSQPVVQPARSASPPPMMALPWQQYLATDSPS
jgi:Concanavalin A-like lectin/glucanases superfamily